MRYIVISHQRPNLSPEETTRLYAAAHQFYTGMPEGVKLEADFILADRTGSYSVVNVPDRATMDAIMAPFEGLVTAEIHALLDAPPGQ